MLTDDGGAAEEGGTGVSEVIGEEDARAVGDRLARALGAARLEVDQRLALRDGRADARLRERGNSL